MKTTTLMERACPPQRSWNPFTLHAPWQGSAPALPSALTGPGCPGQLCISLLAPVSGRAPVTCSPVSQDCLSTTPSHCKLRACGALLVSPLSECPASGGKESYVGSSPGEAEWVRRGVGTAAGSPDDWSHLATQPGLCACDSFLPSFLPKKHLKHLRSPPLSPTAPSPSVALPPGRPALTPQPKPTVPLVSYRGCFPCLPLSRDDSALSSLG